MSRKKKLLEKLMGGLADKSFPFDDLVLLISHEGWVMRGGGSSHKIFRNIKNPSLPMLNIQKQKDGTAKSYQVEQAREAIAEKNKNERQKNEE